MTYGRLAILEEKYGNPKEYEKYMREASKGCEEINWRDCSPERIRQLIERLNRKLPNND